MERRNGSRWKANEKKNFSLNVSEICRHLSHHEHIYIYIYTCTFTAVHYCLSISKAWLSPRDRARDSIRNSELRNECALPHSRPHPGGEEFHNRTDQFTRSRGRDPSCDIRYSIELRISSEVTSRRRTRKQGAKDERKRKGKEERKIAGCFWPVSMGQASPIYFNLAFRRLTAVFQRSRKNGSRQKVFKSRPKMCIPGRA